MTPGPHIDLPRNREPRVHVERLMRSYGEVVALTDVTTDLEAGVVGLLGPNGAGKTTLLRVLSGELRADLGTVEVLGRNPFGNFRLYQHVAICPQKESLFEDATGHGFVTFMLELRGFGPRDAAERATAWMDRFGMTDAAHRRVSGYSKGMRQRTKLAAVLSQQAQVYLLDEPLTGLDPVWRHRVMQTLRDLGRSGALVVFSSHVLHEVEQVTRQVLLLHRGRVLAQGDSREIRAIVDTIPHRVHVEAAAARDLGVRLLTWDCVESVKVREGGLDLTTPRPDVFYRRFTAEAADEELGVSAISSPDDSLQAVFDVLVGK